MISFKEFILNEAIDESNFTKKQSKNCELFLGRMQPVHLGHKAIIDSMKNPVVALVKGAKSSLDKEKNPFDEKDQMRFLKKLDSSIEVVIAKTGYVPDIIEQLRKEGMEVSTVYAGEDRISGYRRQIDGFNKAVSEEYQMDIKFKETPRITSATTVRNALKADDKETFKKNMPRQLHSEYEYMKSKVD
jgi:FAD synthase